MMVKDMVYVLVHLLASVCFFGETSVCLFKCFVYFLIEFFNLLLLKLEHLLCALDMSSLSGVSFTNIFLHSVTSHSFFSVIHLKFILP